MRGSQNAKAMAKTLRQELKDRTIDIGHSECLEIVARQLGYRNWNTISAIAVEADAPDLKPLPAGWEFIGTNKARFRIGLEEGAGQDGQAAIRIQGQDEATTEDVIAWAAFRQYFSAEDYRGRNIRFSVTLRCERVTECAFPWLRVDNALGQKLGYIGRWELPEKDVFSGTQAWHKRELIIAVPINAHSIEFGVTLLKSVGIVWAADLEFAETSDPETRPRPVTARAPQNLSLTAA